jgi:hypothetical protein
VYGLRYNPSPVQGSPYLQELELYMASVIGTADLKNTASAGFVDRYGMTDGCEHR